MTKPKWKFLPKNLVPMFFKPKIKKCDYCGKRLHSSSSPLCKRCQHFKKRIHVRRFSPEVVKAILAYVRKYGYVCYYTGMSLDMDNPKSPWYCVFDHWSPRNPNKIVLTSALLNGMKSDLTEKEFWSFVIQLDNHRKKHWRIRKIMIRFWNRLVPSSPQSRWFQGGRQMKCCGCGRTIYGTQYVHPKYCHACSEIARRMDNKGIPASARQAVWDYLHQYGYVCYYTGMRLELNDPQSPWYCVLEYWTPGSNKKVVLTFALLNEMKLDLTEKEFWYYIGQLANFRRKYTKVKKRRLVHWNRLYPQRIERLAARLKQPSRRRYLPS